MKKSSRYIVICITALFLSFCIPVVSFADDVGVTFYPTCSIYSAGSYQSAEITVSLPARHYSDSILFNCIPSDPVLPIANYYHYWYREKTNYNDYYSAFREDIRIGDYDYYTTSFVLPNRRLSTSNETLRVVFSKNGTSVYNKYLYTPDFSQSGYYEDSSVHLIWNSSSVTVYDVNGNSVTMTVVSFATAEFNNIDADTLTFYVFCGSQGSNQNYVEYIVPIFVIKGFNNSSGGDTSGDISGDNSGDSGVDLSGIEGQLDDMTQSIVDTMDAVNGVTDEVSRLGEDISQFHNDLTSYDESYAPSVNDYNMSDNIDTINSFDTEISNFLDDNNGYTSYDYDTEYSSIGDNFSWDEQTDGDMSFWEFVVSLWSTLQMRVIIVAFVPLAFAFVIFKFVIGGIM